MNSAILLLVAAGISLIAIRCLRDSLMAEYHHVGIEPQPDTSDEEFLALMPNVPPDVALGVRDVLVDATGWDREEIHPDTRLIEFQWS